MNKLLSWFFASAESVSDELPDSDAPCIGDVYISESEWVKPNSSGISVQDRITIMNITKDGQKILCKYSVYDSKKSKMEVEHGIAVLNGMIKEESNNENSN